MGAFTGALPLRGVGECCKYICSHPDMLDMLLLLFQKYLIFPSWFMTITVFNYENVCMKICTQFENNINIES